MKNTHTHCLKSKAFDGKIDGIRVGFGFKFVQFFSLFFVGFFFCWFRFALYEHLTIHAYILLAYSRENQRR